MTYNQDTLLLRNYNDLAIVPDFNLKRKRVIADSENQFPLKLFEDSFGLKRHCMGDISPENSFLLDSGITVQPNEVQGISKNQLTVCGQVTDSYITDCDSMQKVAPLCLPCPQSTSNVVEHPKCILTITEEPEQYYRARYDSEGVRAPLKGMTDNYPAVQVIGQPLKHAIITVKLVHEDGSEHTCCSLDHSDERKKALTKKVDPLNNMKAEFEDLRIRREKKKEGGRGSIPHEKRNTNTRDGRHDKIACLLFSAVIDTNNGIVECSVMSSPISLTAAPEPAELDWLEPGRCHFGGKETVVIKGSKMTSPKVSFQLLCPNGEVFEVYGTVDKDKSHQNVLLVKTPDISSMPSVMGHQRILAKVVVITGRSQMSSNSLDFEFIPNDVCRECMRDKSPVIQKLSPASFHSPTSFSFGVSSPPTVLHKSPEIQPSLFDFASSQLPFERFTFTPSESTAPSPSMLVIRAGATDSSNPTSVDSMQSYADFVTPEQYKGAGMDNSSSLQACTPPMSGTDDLMYIMQELMSPDSTSIVEDSNTACTHTSGECSPRMCLSEEVLLNNAVANTNCERSPSDFWECVENMLYSLHQNHLLSKAEMMVYLDQCHCHSVDLMGAFRLAQGDMNLFLQQLASIKLSNQFPPTH